MIRLSDEARRHLALFEDVTDVAARDCVLDPASERGTEQGGDEQSGQDDRVVFVVPPAEMSAAIGPGGRTVSRVEEKLGKRVELVEDADTPAEFVANALRPAAVYDVTVRKRQRDSESDDEASSGPSEESETVAYAEVDGDDFGAAIGAGGRNISMAKELVARHYDVDDIQLVPDPDSSLDAVGDVTDVEGVDALFDAADERLLVLVPSGTLDEASGDEHADELQSRLGWPVEFVAYGGSAAELIANALAPATVYNVTVSQSGVAYAEVDRDHRGLAIGKNGRRIRRARLLAKQYYGIDDVELA